MNLAHLNWFSGEIILYTMEPLHCLCSVIPVMQLIYFMLVIWLYSTILFGLGILLCLEFTLKLVNALPSFPF